MTELLIDFLLGTSAHSIILTSSWVWACAEIFHFIGLCLLIGSMLAVDFALMGLLTGVKLQEIKRLLRLSAFGFFFSASTGVIFLIGDPQRYLTSTIFQLKVVLLVFIGLNAVYFGYQLRFANVTLTDQKMQHKYKWIGLFSIISWCLVVVFGRLIPYIE